MLDLEGVLVINALDYLRRKEIDFPEMRPYLHLREGTRDFLDKSKDNFRPALSKLWKIPVCYNTDFGLDLEEIASTKKMSVNDIIKAHGGEIIVESKENIGTTFIITLQIQS